MNNISDIESKCWAIYSHKISPWDQRLQLAALYSIACVSCSIINTVKAINQDLHGITNTLCRMWTRFTHLRRKNDGSTTPEVLYKLSRFWCLFIYFLHLLMSESIFSVEFWTYKMLAFAEFVRMYWCNHNFGSSSINHLSGCE